MAMFAMPLTAISTPTTNAGQGRAAMPLPARPPTAVPMIQAAMIIACPTRGRSST